ncbi:hypothetical protein B0H19DRAFT_1085083 [Mycena capillaripes]|nr:hypothetical protein B0H19DRAFT_1085083 [Mycena capillaripes]
MSQANSLQFSGLEVSFSPTLVEPAWLKSQEYHTAKIASLRFIIPTSHWLKSDRLFGHLAACLEHHMRWILTCHCKDVYNFSARALDVQDLEDLEELALEEELKSARPEPRMAANNVLPGLESFPICPVCTSALFEAARAPWMRLCINMLGARLHKGDDVLSPRPNPARHTRMPMQLGIAEDMELSPSNVPKKVTKSAKMPPRNPIGGALHVLLQDTEFEAIRVPHSDKD